MNYPRCTSSALRHVAVLAAALCGFAGTLTAQLSDTTIFGWTERKLTAVVLSTVLPGTGQTYLGHSSKGAALTVGMFGCGLVAAISENNVVGRNERLEELQALYQQSTTWVSADYYWRQMVETKGILDRDMKRRDLFAKLTIAVWVANMVDIILFSEDIGQVTFGSRTDRSRVHWAIHDDPQGSIRASFFYDF